ncbi:hypothetical protein GIB67_006103 [Kingdonia uniflora]|uniref:Uncharacterized protein n=1 Tax=Kingdonia uniflora TaxID=39325 RepID=A0A7J7LPL9_9MAGN|nr:hypothetical protein GIB67_006103 [Kingdonia uniflora]
MWSSLEYNTTTALKCQTWVSEACILNEFGHMEIIQNGHKFEMRGMGLVSILSRADRLPATTWGSKSPCPSGSNWSLIGLLSGGGGVWRRIEKIAFGLLLADHLFGFLLIVLFFIRLSPLEELQRGSADLLLFRMTMETKWSMSMFESVELGLEAIKKWFCTKEKMTKSSMLLRGLAATGKNYNNSLTVRKAYEFQLSTQLASGGWGESYMYLKILVDICQQTGFITHSQQHRKSNIKAQ